MKIRVLTIAACAVLAACQPEGGAPAASVDAPVTAAANDATATIQATSSPMLKVTPASLHACEPASEVTVNWDAASAKDITGVQLWVEWQGESKLFLEGGAAGEAKTGMWTRPGNRFILKRQDGNGVLGEAVVGGPRCS